MLNSLFGKPNINRMKSKGDIQGLINVLGHTKDVAVREAVIQALIQVGKPAFDELRKLVMKSYNSSMSDVQRDELIRAKHYAILCLVQIGDTEAVDPLIQAMKYGESAIKESAYIALTKLTTVEKIVPPLLYELAIGSTELFSNEYVSTYSTPYSATIKGRLISLGSSVVPHLLNVLQGHRIQLPERGRYNRAAFECHIIEVLGDIGNHQAFTPLLQIMETTLDYSELTSIRTPLPLHNASVREAIGDALIKLSFDTNDVKAFLTLAERTDGRYVEFMNKVGLLESKMSNIPEAALYIKNWIETRKQEKI